MKRRLSLAVVTMCFVLSLQTAFMAHAQDETLAAVQLIDITIVDQLIVSVPEDWLTWRRSDYETNQEAMLALREMFEVVYTTKQNFSLSDDVAFVAIPPVIGASMKVDVLDLDAIATILGVPAEEVNPAYVMTILQQTVWGIHEVNRRSTAYGDTPDISAILTTTSFPEQKLFTQVQFITDTNWRAEHLYLLTVLSHSLRIEGEEIDIEAIEKLMEMDLPEHILLSQADTAELGSETEATAEAEIEPEAIIACSVQATNNVNVRGGPGTSYDVAGSLVGGTSIAAIGQVTSSDGRVWWQLENDSWVRSDVVVETGECDLLPVTTP